MLIFMSQGCLAQDFVFKAETEQFSAPLGGMLLEETRIPVSAAKKKYSISFFSLPPFEEYIVQTVLTGNSLPKKIGNLEDYGIHVDDFEDIYMDVVMKNPETLLRPKWHIEYEVNTGIVSSVLPEYVVETYEDAVQARKDMAAAVKEYTDLASGYDTMLEKLLVVHDKMIADCDYDVRVLSEDKAIAESVDVTVRHALGVFRHELAVCQGFAQAMYMILQELGLEVDFCHSDKANHIWNYVKLDGKWYHLDMTSDDPVLKYTDGSFSPRTDTRAWHRYFMVSDAGLSVSLHGDDYDVFIGEKYVCDDAKYESDYLFNMNDVFTAQRGEDGLYHVYTDIAIPPIGVDVTLDHKSDSLYTGPLVVTPCITEGTYSVEENGKTVEKTGTNLYFVMRATRDVPQFQPIMKWNTGEIEMLESRAGINKYAGSFSLAYADIDANTLPAFTAFLLKKDDLAPCALKTTWNAQQ